MKRNKSFKHIIIAAAAVMALASCGSTAEAPKPLYSWGNYEDVTYQYKKKNTDQQRTKLLEEYSRLIANQTASRGTVPPGLYAEYGYLLYQGGDRDKGIEYLNKEIALYPESEAYISRILKQLK